MTYPNIPSYIMIQTTSRCNAACRFCPYPALESSLPHGTMDPALFKKIVDECSFYPEIKRIMPYLMNDPLMDKHLEEKINYIKTKNPQSWVHFLTNGNLLTRERGEQILKSRLDQICFSVHGVNKMIYEETMGINFEQTIQNITAFIEKAKQLKPENYIMITFFKWQALDDTERQNAIAFWQAQGIHQISTFDGPISRAGNVPAIPGPHKTAVRGCQSIWTNEMFHILYNGDVVLCCMDWKRETVLGNVRHDSIYSIWHSPRYQALRAQVCGEQETGPQFLCKRCEASVG